MNPIQKAIAENRIQFFSNGSYSYIPSIEYRNKFFSKPIHSGKIKLIDIKKATDSFIRAKNVARVKGKKLDKVSEGKFVFS